MSRARSTERMYEKWGCFTSPIKPMPDVLQTSHAFGCKSRDIMNPRRDHNFAASLERDTLNPVDESVPKYPGPGRYPTEKILTAFKSEKDFSKQHIPDERARPETPGPGQYTTNYGAVMVAQPFDDLFRHAPLKNLSTTQVKIKQISREIKQLKYKKALALPSLPVEKQKTMCKETKALVEALLKEKGELEAVDAEERRDRLQLPRHTVSSRRKNAAILPLSPDELVHQLTRPQSVPFMHSERRFFDAIDITHTKYETPMPGHCQRLDIHSGFDKSPRLPTIPKANPPDVLPFHQGVVFTSKANPSSETGPGEYMPDVVGLAPPTCTTPVHTERLHLTVELFHHATKTKLPARQFMQQVNLDRMRKKAHQSKLVDVAAVRQLDHFHTPSSSPSKP
ncbi:Aste57867_16830 [Aphanomyces stellatus]|uniref:Aste57867_16830 protein n=1 Tax=Aphanomyces stellatus TaxID=120398 RepID=A0A485L6G7_9STRA|nr:hypothetical protein As57867_016772 [Aphanomyces stellatus]VFT93594.1 Aste57867_16830 [Aphanomyces stellatus]